MLHWLVHCARRGKQNENDGLPADSAGGFCFLPDRSAASVRFARIVNYKKILVDNKKETVYDFAGTEKCRCNSADRQIRRKWRKHMKISTRTIVTVGMFTAVLSVMSIVTIPMPSGVPVTLQTFAVALCGYVLGSKKGFAATVVYILLGTVGVPVFAGMTGGPSWLAGYSGGFIWGFLFLSFLCGFGMERRLMAVKLACGLTGLFFCHLIGVIQFAAVASVSVPAAFVSVSLPYLFKDVISVSGAYLAAVPIRKTLAVCGMNDRKRNAA